jgi:hypothetical protein
VTAEKVAYTPSLFARPTLSKDQEPAVGNVVATRPLSLNAAERALGGRAKSLGSRFAGLALTDARLDSLRTGYGVLSHKPIQKSSGVEFVYGSGTERGGTGPYLRLSEALSPQMAYFAQTAKRLTPGTLSLITFRPSPVEKGQKNKARAFRVGQLRTDHLYVTIEGSTRSSVIAAAKALAGIS